MVQPSPKNPPKRGKGHLHNQGSSASSTGEPEHLLSCCEQSVPLIQQLSRMRLGSENQHQINEAFKNKIP